MRIIAGRLKGRSLFSPEGREVRPTSDKARQALFNIIGPGVDGASFLDLFAGTGAVGLEALSRGAASVTAVERSPATAKRNAQKLGVGPDNGYTLLAHDVFAEAQSACKRGLLFGYIFADPPWGEGLEERILSAAAPLLAQGGTLILELNRRTPPPDGAACGLALADSRRYGEAVFHFYHPDAKVDHP